VEHEDKEFVQNFDVEVPLEDRGLEGTEGNCRVLVLLLVRFPMRSLEFSIGLMLPAALWTWCRLSLEQK
jgi:hypothetical protein